MIVLDKEKKCTDCLFMTLGATIGLDRDIDVKNLYKCMIAMQNEVRAIEQKLNKVTGGLTQTQEQLGEARDQIDALSKLIYVDSLTDCYNQNFFIRYKSTFDPKRKNNRIGIVCIDINNLKYINDTEGHRAGDKLICDAADNLRSIFRRSDTIIRIGGDEFVVICENQDNISNFENVLAQKVHKRLHDRKISNLAIGVAVFNDSIDESIDETVMRADKLMYAHKKEMKGIL